MTDLDGLVALERSLLASSIRADAATLDRLLHPDFEEVGSSGTVWPRDVIIVRFVTRTDDHLVHRVTVWVRDDAAGSWRARYHQGTRAHQ